MNASSWRDVASVVTGSQREEQLGVTTLLIHASNRDDMFHELIANDKTRGCSLDEAGQFLVRRSHFGQWMHTQHNYIESFFKLKTVSSIDSWSFLCFFLRRNVWSSQNIGSFQQNKQKFKNLWVAAFISPHVSNSLFLIFCRTQLLWSVFFSICGKRNLDSRYLKLRNCQLLVTVDCF